MKEDLFKYLKTFIIQSNWLDENIPEQTRAIFTTICLVGNIIADTSECDNMLMELYRTADLKSVDIGYDEFNLFMCGLIV